MITLIVTVRYRQCTLPRILEYYKNFPGSVIIADSSPEPYEMAYDYPYAEYYFSPNTSWMEMMVQTLKKVKTKYVVVICDDDFLLIPSIDPQIKFLEDNPNYSLLMGQEVALFDNYLGYETLEYIFASKYWKSNSQYKKDRFNTHWTYFTSRVHGITRTDLQLNIHEAMIRYPHLHALRFFDKIFSLMAAVEGDIGVIPVCSLVRSQETLTGKVYLSDNFLLDGKPKDEIKDDLKFKSDFLNRDLTFLQNLIGISREEIEMMHSNLCSQEALLVEYDKMLEKYSLKCESSEIENGRIVFQNSLKIEGYPLVPRYGPAASNEYFSKFKYTDDDWSEVYPVYMDENLSELSTVVQLVKKYPLTDWGGR
jgi:glycosyltransferase domain-containing protein